MKTKFTDIVKIRKRKVDELRDYLSKLEFNIQTVRLSVEQLTNEFYSEKMPVEGNMRKLLAIQEIKKAYKVEIENKKAHLSNLIQSKQNVSEMLREANVEYEKMLHLHELELKAFASLRKQKEAKDLDEIAVMLFNNKFDK